MSPKRIETLAALALIAVLAGCITWQQDKLMGKRARLAQLQAESAEQDQWLGELAEIHKEKAEFAQLSSSAPDIEGLRAELKHYRAQAEARRKLIEMATRKPGQKTAQASQGATPVPATAPAAEAEGTFNLNQVDTPPRAVKQVRPEYPLGLRMEEGTGKVILSFVVDTDGSVLDVIEVPPKDGNPLPDADFVDSAIRAVAQWRFNPATKNGKPVKTLAQVPVVFHMGPPKPPAPKPKGGS